MIVGGQIVCGTQWLEYPWFPIDHSNLFEVVWEDFIVTLVIAVAVTLLFFALLLVWRVGSLGAAVTGLILGAYYAYMTLPYSGHHTFSFSTGSVLLKFSELAVLLLGVPVALIWSVCWAASIFARKRAAKTAS